MRTNGIIQLFPLLRIAVCLALGVCVGYEVSASLMPWMWFAMMAASVVGILLLRRYDLWQGAMLCVASFLLGATLVARQVGKANRPLPVGDVTYEAVVASQPQERGKVVRMDLWVVGGPHHGRKIKASLLRDTLTGYYKKINVGDGLVVTSEWQQPTQYYPSHFNYPLYLRCHGFTATTLILPGNWWKASVSLQPLSYLDRTILVAMQFRESTLRKYLSLGLDDDEMAVAVAMALGDRSRLTNDLRDIYSISGASHVLALSGLHLSIIYVLLSLLVGWRRLGVLREVLIIGGIWAYALFTGLSPSVVRASVMITIFSLVGLIHRRRMSLNALALTVIIMLVVNPLSLYDVGFEMSVMAVLAILVCYKPVYGLVSQEFLLSHRVVKWIWAMVVVSCCAQLGAAPLTAYYFGRFSVYFLLTNFIVIPLATAVLYLTAAMLMAALVPPVLPWVAKLLAIVVGWQTTMVKWVSDLPESHIEGIDINRIQLWMIYVFIAAVAIIFYFFAKSRFRSTVR
ncbi:MAG: ComEC/Rec2 family competence protein [Prevotella sp.]|nr:ComEC/Rec2 family competence protein [Prevotella sp.]